VLLEALKGFNILLHEILFALWSVDSYEDFGEAFVGLVLINGQEHILEELLLGENSIIKVVENVKNEQMCNLVGDHFLEWLLKRFEDDLSVFGVKEVEESTCNVESLF